MGIVLIEISVCITSIVRQFYLRKVGSTDPSCTFSRLRAECHIRLTKNRRRRARRHHLYDRNLRRCDFGLLAHIQATLEQIRRKALEREAYEGHLQSVWQQIYRAQAPQEFRKQIVGQHCRRS